MKLNLVEKAMMNNPIRAWVQRHYEAKRLLQMGGPAPGAFALEVGCGRGVGAEIMLDMFDVAHVDAFDLDPDMVRRAAKRLAKRGDQVTLWTGSATEIDKPDATYDAAFDFGIVHHIPDWRAALREVFRVLKPGGRFYAEEVFAKFINHPVWRRLLVHPREDRFDRAGFVDGLCEVGFDVIDTAEHRGRFGWFIADKPVS